MVDRDRNFVVTPELDVICDRALRYLRAAVPVHFRGCAGSGKTALALHLARRIGRPVLFMTGDAMHTTEDLLGRETGIRTRQVVDRYVRTVRKIENETTVMWEAEALTQACLNGYTLIYDEFTRSRPEANNALLPALEERVLMLPASAGRSEPYVAVHPEFRAIFTSNSLEYRGVQQAQDALLDRMITLDLDFVDRDTEISIVSARSGLAPDLAACIVDTVRDYRASGVYDQMPTMRASIMIGTIAMREGLPIRAADPAFMDLVLDVLVSKGAPGRTAAEREALVDVLRTLTAVHCAGNTQTPVEDTAASLAGESVPELAKRKRKA
jgi:nitric oxide reductase NorQ protein